MKADRWREETRSSTSTQTEREVNFCLSLYAHIWLLDCLSVFTGHTQAKDCHHQATYSQTCARNTFVFQWLILKLTWKSSLLFRGMCVDRCLLTKGPPTVRVWGYTLASRDSVTLMIHTVIFHMISVSCLSVLKMDPPAVSHPEVSSSFPLLKGCVWGVFPGVNRASKDRGCCTLYRL